MPIHNGFAARRAVDLPATMTTPEASTGGTLLAVNVGMPRDVQWRDRTVHTGIWKRPVDGPVMVRRLNVDGDGQGDLGGHGGEQRAVMLYQAESYRYWEQQLGLEPLEYGAFGENFTITGMADDQVCIGDRYRVGEATLEVTQPRVTCFRIGVRLGQPQMPGLLVAHRRPGFYLRVIREGHVRAGDTLELISRGPHALTVAEVDGLLYLPDPDIDRVRDASEVPALSPGWRQSFAEILAAHESRTTTPGMEVGSEPGWQGFRPLTVTRLAQETEQVLSIELHAEGRGALPMPLPGQYLTLQVVGASNPAPVRSYSICAVTDSGGYRIAVKREGLVSSWLHAHLRVGKTLQAAAPRGVFTLDSRPGTPVVLISAGIGVTPVLAMLHSLAAAGSPRVVWWLHTVRDGQHHPFAAEARELLARLPNAHAQVYYSRSGPPEDGVIAGPLDGAALGRLPLPVDATVYTCGPQAFMEQIASACRLLGITDVRRELFGSPDAINPGIVGEPRLHHPHVPVGELGDGPLVTFSRSGLSAPWAGQRYASLLEFAESCDVPTRWACRSGVCHVCSTPVVSGAVRYVNDPPIPPPAGEVLLCSCQPAGPIILDM
jgi:MOSC domain-containing protein YiiM/ferredoxin-NADP reductase